MTFEQIFKDVTDIYSRLFNHKAALQGLNQNFVKEFEEKRDETMSLSRTSEWVKDCTDRIYPSTQQGLEDIHQVKEAVEKASKSCQRIVQDETDKKMEWLEEQRARRLQEYTEFTQNNASARRQHADREFEVRADDLRKHYADLEAKLNQGAVGRVL
ncbi:biogenesis of lysosome-related organelles complex 1 subunit 5-like [Elysia marginata]|uniref:Biogenesis of lysosome-related organelles complex 1 subunit 5 n=1 Tax=Elysia marginata TaxID=1093978 RepID=A0AAV4FC93_9GAST|nr:biogenesis of lysosome-related organelles complex 1 subunit 5-like [Elysia marginata]